MRSPALAALVPTLALAALAACDGPDRGPRWRPAGATSPREGGTLRVAAKTGVTTLDPAFANDDISAWVLHPLFDTLLDYEPGGTRLIPRLAERWEVSPDDRTFRFWLRDGLAYEDGRPIVAADIAYALDRARRTDSSLFASFLSDLECTDAAAPRCSGIRVLGDRELELRLARPSQTFLYVLAMKFTAPLRADYHAGVGDRLRRRPLASGPYRVVSWSEGERMVLERNPHYRDPARQRIERIVLLENVPRDVQFLMFERGELDTIDRPSAPDLVWIAGRDDWKPYIQAQPQLNVYGLRMDVRKQPFNDRRVRQALNYALNKRYTVKLLTNTTTPSHGILPPTLAGRDDTIEPYPYDPAKARALLAEAGYGAGLTLDYVTIPENDAQTLLPSIIADFAAVGVTLKVTEVSWATYMTQVAKTDGGLPFSYAGWSGDYPDPNAYFTPKFHSRSIGIESSQNDSFYSNPELDRLIDEARAERDPDRRAALYRRADRIVHDDAPWVWSYHQLTIEVSQPYVRGYRLHPTWARDFTTAWLDLGPDGEPVPR